MLLAALAVFLTTTPAPNATPAALEPISRWIVDSGGDECVLARSFGSSSGPTALQFKVGAMRGPLAGFTLVAPNSGDQGARTGSAVVRLSPGSATFAASMRSAYVADGARRASVLVVADAAFADALAHATRIEIAVDGGEPVAVAVPNIGAALDALHTCRSDLLRRWGADPNALIDFAPGYSIASIIHYDDYPPAALRARQQGRVVALVSVDASGTPIGCKLMVSSGSQDLDDATCRLIRSRGRYPAAAAGDPATRWAIFPVRWVLPTG